MTRWDALVAVCGHLRAGLLGGAPFDPPADGRWELLIEASSHHYVTPALAWCLRDRADVPSDVREYLGAALTLNDERNKRLTEALVRIVAVLNAIGIEPILLKGAARLVDGVYPAPKLRFLGDLDLLIPEERLLDASTALKGAGFDIELPVEFGHDHHHLPMLRHRDTGAGVELHTKLAFAPYDSLVPTDWFRERATLAPLPGLRAYLPEATRAAAHVIVHDQLLHENYRLDRCELRQLLELAMLRAKYDNMIDWTALDRRFDDTARGPVLATFLELANRLLGQPVPGLTHAPRADAMAHFQRTTERYGRLPRSVRCAAIIQSANLVENIPANQEQARQSKMVRK